VNLLTKLCGLFPAAGRKKRPMKNIGQKTISTIETKTVGAALHLVLRMMVMARSPSQNFLAYYIGTFLKMQAFSFPNI
jgi:hypothetical protein